MGKEKTAWIICGIVLHFIATVKEMSFRRFLKTPGGGRSIGCPKCQDGISEVTIDPNTDNPDEAWQRLSCKHSVKEVEPCNPATPKEKGFTRFVCISDTFSRTDYMPAIPDGDVLLHTGNFSNLGIPREIEAFNEFLGKLPHRYKIVIAGNHEVTFDPQLMTERNSHVFISFATALQEVEEEEWKNCKRQLTNCIYLEDDEVRVQGFRIYGTPWTPGNGDWAFNLSRGQACLDKWDKIPNGIDILLTHGPPVGYCDIAQEDKHEGCVELLNTVRKRVKPKYHVFGHIPEGHGITSNGTTNFINASICTRNYKPANQPIVFDLATPRVPTVEAESSV